MPPLPRNGGHVKQLWRHVPVPASRPNLLLKNGEVALGFAGRGCGNTCDSKSLIRRGNYTTRCVRGVFGYTTCVNTWRGIAAMFGS